METIIVWAIVGLILFFAGRSAFRTLSGKTDGCGCGSKSCGPSDPCCSTGESEDSKQKKA